MDKADTGNLAQSGTSIRVITTVKTTKTSFYINISIILTQRKELKQDFSSIFPLKPSIRLKEHSLRFVL